MKSLSLKKGVAIATAAFVLTACESLDTKDEFVEEPVQEETETTAAPAEPQITEEELAAQRAAEAKRKAEEAARRAAEKAKQQMAKLREIRTFYFDFDQSSIKSESRENLAAHAKFLVANPSVKVLLEGHCDERGTKAYNIALGESRAKAVAQFLKVNGVSDSQIETISYGEEKPAAKGQTESAWSKNRRVFLEYK